MQSVADSIRAFVLAAGSGVREVVPMRSFNLVLTTAETDAAALQRHANNRKVSMHLRDRFPYPYEMEQARADMSGIAAQIGKGMGVAIADYDGDGFIDMWPMTSASLPRRYRPA
jgi:hypothetical protein